MTEFVMIRHGETDWNLAHRFQGQIDVSLNARGHAQAERLAQRLADEAFDAVYCSDLARAVQTVEPLAAQRSLEPVCVRGLREQGFGVLEGLALPEILERHADVWAQWRRHDADYAPPGGGESTRAFHARALAALARLAERHPAHAVLVVTHGGVLDMVWRSASGQPLHGPRACLIPNTGVNRVRVVGGRFEIDLWADDAHVADLGGVHPLMAAAEE